MNSKTIFLAGLSLVSCHPGVTQTAAVGTDSPPAAGTLHDIGRAIKWMRIGAPPSLERQATRAEEWQRESAAYKKAFSLLKQSWSVEAADNPSDLRFRVRQYEDLIKTVTDAGGYGNLVLADTARRLSLGLLSQYVVTHPSEYATVGDLLADLRIRLLDCPATSDMIADELGLAPPSGSWHLSEGKQDLVLIFGNDGSSFRTAGGSSLWACCLPRR